MRNPLQWIGIWLELADKKQRKSWIWMKLEQLSPSESPWPRTVIFHIPNSFFNRSLFCPNTWIKLQNGPRFSRCHSSTSHSERLGSWWPNRSPMSFVSARPWKKHAAEPSRLADGVSSSLEVSQRASHTWSIPGPPNMHKYQQITSAYAIIFGP